MFSLGVLFINFSLANKDLITQAPKTRIFIILRINSKNNFVYSTFLFLQNVFALSVVKEKTCKQATMLAMVFSDFFV